MKTAFFGESGPLKYVLNAPIHRSTYEPRANLVIRENLIRPSLYSYHNIPRKCQQAFTIFRRVSTACDFNDKAPQYRVSSPMFI